jgi:hypothetical protein
MEVDGSGKSEADGSPELNDTRSHAMVHCLSRAAYRTRLDGIALAFYEAGGGGGHGKMPCVLFGERARWNGGARRDEDGRPICSPVVVTLSPLAPFVCS